MLTDKDKEILVGIVTAKLFYGEIAHKLEPKYGDDTLRCFAQEIRYDYAKLIDCLNLYRYWKYKQGKISDDELITVALFGDNPPKRDLFS